MDIGRPLHFRYVVQLGAEENGGAEFLERPPDLEAGGLRLQPRSAKQYRIAAALSVQIVVERRG